jgi:hypothetical protein
VPKPCKGTVALGTLPSTNLGHSPYRTAVADIDGDGILDVVTANADASVSLLLGTGTGTLTLHDTLSVPTAPTTVLLRDLNHDQRVDIVVLDWKYPAVSVLLQNGDGSFAAPVEYATTASPASLAAGDIDGDGVLDLVTTNYDSAGTVSVLIGNGDGTFSSHADIAQSHPHDQIQVADVNGDGASDLVMIQGSGSNVTVQLNTADHTFAPPVDYTTGANPAALAIADLDADGDLDLVTANWGNVSSHAVSVLLGDGSGAFALHTDYSVTQPYDSVALGDVNEDGVLDIIAGYDQRDAALLLGVGDGTFAAALYISGALHDRIVLGDFNRDRHLDILGLSSDLQLVGVRLGNGKGEFSLGTTLAMASRPTAVALGDFDADQRLDIAATSQDSTLSIWRNQSDGTFASSQKSNFGNMPSLVAAPLNRDTTVDLVTGNVNLPAVTTALGLGQGAFADSVSWSIASLPGDIAVGDVNGDGALDLAAIDVTAGVVMLMVATAADTFAPAPNVSVETQLAAWAFGDLNHDGYADLITVESVDTSATLRVRLGNGDGTFAAAATHSLYKRMYYAGAMTVAIGDLNGDGWPDIVVANGIDAIDVVLGTGQGQFAAPAAYLVPWSPGQIALGDLNGDGVLDITTTAPGVLGVSWGNGDGTLSNPTEYPLEWLGPLALAIGDLNNDSRLDIAVASSEKGVTVLFNTCIE